MLAPVAAAATTESRSIAGERTKRHTGQLEGGYRSEVRLVGGGPILARVHTENRVPHALFMEDGTKRHNIPAKDGRPIRFKGKGGRWVTIAYPRVIDHPGTKPYHIIRDALRRVALRKAFR